MCTPPACTVDETYSCPGNCPGGCGTVCATVTPDAAWAPLANVPGAGQWIVRAPDNLVFLDPSGAKPGFALQRFYAPLTDFILIGAGHIYSLTDPGDGTLALNQVYPKEHWIANLDAKRNVDGSLRTAPIFSADGDSLVWSRAEVDGSLTRALFVTSLESGKSREVWRTELPAEAAGHALVPLYFDEARQLLVYALHTFYSGMTPTQVASLYLADLAADKITPLWALHSNGMAAGVSAKVSPDGSTLAYLTWGESQADFTLPWTLHLRDLTTGKETEQHLAETWENVEVHFFAPDGKSLALNASRHAANNGYRSDLLIFDLQKQTWNSVYSADDSKPFLLLRAWSSGNWLILTSDADNSTWVMRPDGQALTQITPLEWIGMLQP
jgi:dipeptidyl aminopeptidase/acylaminoacyl peptidase